MKTSVINFSTNKLDKKSILKLISFYINYSLKTKLLWIVSSVVLFASLLTNAILIRSNNYLNYSLLLIMPFILLSIITTFYLSWKLHSSVIHDGTALFIYSKKFGRKNIFVSKLIVIFGSSMAILLIQTIISLIFNISIGMSASSVMIFSVLLLVCSLFGLIFLISIANLVSIFFSEIYSIVFLTIIGALFSITPFISNKISSQNTNSISWNLNDNQENYAKLIQIDQNNEIVDSSIVVYDAGKRLNNTNNSNENNISTNGGFGLFFDKLITSPFNLMVSPSLSISDQEAVSLSRNHYLSSLNLNDSLKGDISLINNGLRFLPYAVDDKNPLEESYSDILNYWMDVLTNWDSIHFHHDINDSVLMNQMLSRLQTDPKWISTQLTINEKEFISKLVGMNKDDARIFYLFRDWDILKNKFGKVFDDLKNHGINSNFVDLLEYIFTNNDARNNILNQYLVKSQKDIENLFPMSLSQDKSKDATDRNIKEMKDIVSQIDSSSNNPIIRVLTNNNNYEEFPLLNLGINVNSKNEWDSYIDSNSELLNLQNIYSKLKNFVQSNSKQIVEIKFDNNTTDIYQFQKLINLQIKEDVTPLVIMVISLIAISTASMASSYILDKRKDIK